MNILGFLFPQLDQIQKGIEQLMFDLTALKNAVAQEQTVIAAVKTLLGRLTSEIQTLVTASQASGTNTVDPVALQAIVDQVNAQTADLAAAVTANTPADTGGTTPTPPPPPPPPPPAA